MTAARNQQEWRYGYFVVLGVMAAISLGLYFYFKKRGDL